MNDFDVHEVSYSLADEIEHSIHDRDIRGREIHIFDIKEIHIIEKHLKRAYEIGILEGRKATV